MHFTSLLQLATFSAALVAPVAAHPGGHHHIGARELARRQVTRRLRLKLEDEPALVSPNSA